MTDFTATVTVKVKVPFTAEEARPAGGKKPQRGKGNKAATLSEREERLRPVRNAAEATVAKVSAAAKSAGEVKEAFLDVVEPAVME